MNRIVLVTGASRGIGAEICRQLLEKGCHTIRAARNIADLPPESDNASNIQLDVNSIKQIETAVASVEKEFGRLDVLINNAGVIGPESFGSVTIEAIDKVLMTNYMGPLHTTIGFLPLLRLSDDARVINVSSGMGERESLKAGGYAGYRLSKAGLNSQTVLAASDLATDGIKVNAVCPGWVRTDMGGAGAHRPVEKGAETPVWLATESSIPTGKFFRDKKVIDW